jgi:outer membrane lipoprotein-sorting protein
MDSHVGDGRTANGRSMNARKMTRAAGRRPNRAWLRWVPAVAAPAVIAAGVLVGSIPARAGDALPDKTPAEVIALMAGHTTHTFSGTLEQASELGLPELPATGPTSGPVAADGAASAMEFLTGEHTARVFMDGKTNARVQVVDRLAERDIIRRGNDVWFYSSKNNSAAHLTLPAHAGDLPLEDPALPGTGQDGMPVPLTPQDLAGKFLAAAGNSTAVSVGPDVQVAGRPAYGLILEPRATGTLVDKISIAVDGESGMPLSVEVTARGAAEPAFRAGFTSLSLETPDEALFTFVPPPGSTVEELQPRDHTGWPAKPGVSGDAGTHPTPDQLKAGIREKTERYLTGTGWETVVELPAETGAGSQLSAALSQNPLLAQAAAVVPGGKLLSTTLLNVLITDDGRVFAGMVPADRLQAASSAP